MDRSIIMKTAEYRAITAELHNVMTTLISWRTKIGKNTSLRRKNQYPMCTFYRAMLAQSAVMRLLSSVRP